MPKANVGLLVFLYCLKTLGWVATSVGVFLALSYLRAWLQSAWKAEIERTPRSNNRNDIDTESSAATEYRIDVENNRDNHPSSIIESGVNISDSSVNVASPKNDL